VKRSRERQLWGRAGVESEALRQQFMTAASVKDACCPFTVLLPVLITRIDQTHFRKFGIG
jgi:hypothetical protein